MRSLTSRGRAFLAGGLTAALAGMMLGERDLVRVGVLVALVPLLSLLLVRRSGHDLSVSRTPTTHQIEAGGSVGVQVRINNLHAPTGVLLAEEQLPYALGERPRFVINPIGRDDFATVDYVLRPQSRGRYQIGPLSLRFGDPLGMVDARETQADHHTLLVTPRTVPLPEVSLSGSWTGSGENRARPYSSGAAPDIAIRDYRRGDDLRRVHWRSSARVGQLMVRREEQPWQSRGTLLIDNRRSAHRGTGPSSSFEAAVRVAASIARHLGDHGFQIRLVSASGLEQRETRWHDGSALADVRRHLEQLAVIEAVDAPRFNSDWIEEGHQQGGMVIAVLGATHDHDAAFLSRLGGFGASARAVVLDVDRWHSNPTGTPPAIDWLRAKGWSAAALGPSDQLAPIWRGLGR